MDPDPQHCYKLSELLADVLKKEKICILILRHYQAHHQPGLPALRYTGSAEDPQVGTILNSSIFLSNSHRLNMESDLQSLFGLHVQLG
jgi:hypothetical protein